MVQVLIVLMACSSLHVQFSILVIVTGGSSGRLCRLYLRQLLTAWLDCRSWTEDNIPRIVDLEGFHFLGCIANTNMDHLTLYTTAVQCCSSFVFASTREDMKC